MALVQYLFVAEGGVYGFLCYDPRTGRGGYGGLIRLTTVVRILVDYFGLCLISSAMPSIRDWPTLRIDAQQKLPGLPWIRFLAVSPTALPTVGCASWCKLLSRCQGEMRAVD